MGDMQRIVDDEDYDIWINSAEVAAIKGNKIFFSSELDSQRSKGSGSSSETDYKTNTDSLDIDYSIGGILSLKASNIGIFHRGRSYQMDYSKVEVDGNESKKTQEDNTSREGVITLFGGHSFSPTLDLGLRLDYKFLSNILGKSIHTFDSSSPEKNWESKSDINDWGRGFLIAGGIVYRFNPALSLGGQLHYSSYWEENRWERSATRQWREEEKISSYSRRDGMELDVSYRLKDELILKGYGYFSRLNLNKDIKSPTSIGWHKSWIRTENNWEAGLGMGYEASPELLTALAYKFSYLDYEDESREIDQGLPNWSKKWYGGGWNKVLSLHIGVEANLIKNLYLRAGAIQNFYSSLSEERSVEEDRLLRESKRDYSTYWTDWTFGLGYKINDFMQVDLVKQWISGNSRSEKQKNPLEERYEEKDSEYKNVDLVLAISLRL